MVWLLVACVVAVSHRPGGELLVDVESVRGGNAQLFLDRGQGFNEADSIVRRFGVGRSTIAFAIPSGRYAAFRFDPSVDDAPTTIWSMRIAGGNGTTRMVDLATAALGNAQRQPVGHGFRVVPAPGTNDPQLTFNQPFDFSVGIAWIQAATLAAGLVLLFAFGLALAATQVRTRGLVAGAIAIAATLALALAVGSGSRVYDHPDEFSHLMALKFYLDHGLLPPAVLDPRAGPSISVWGFSYLFEVDVFYPITALILKAAGHSQANLLPDIRLFNVCLLVVLALAASRSRALAVAASVVLLSPQIWYVFGYYSADAFALTLALLLAGLAADEDGDVARCLRGEPYRRTAIAAFVLIAALLLCSKRNYVVVFPVVGMWLAVRYARFGLAGTILAVAGLALLGLGTFLSTPMIGPPIEGAALPRYLGLALLAAATVFWLWRLREAPVPRATFLRLLAIGALCVAIAAPRHLWDWWQNGSSATKAAAMLEVAERTAGDGFKPSQVLSPERRPEIALVRNGVGLWNLVGERQWAKLSLHSAYGYYGFMSMPAPFWTALALFGLNLLLFGLGGFALRAALPVQWLPLIIVSVGGAALVVESSLIHSWVNAYNPQGRYLFPAFVLLALPMIATHRRLPRAAFRAALLGSVALSAYSFVFVAFATFMAM